MRVNKDLHADTRKLYARADSPTVGRAIGRVNGMGVAVLAARFERTLHSG